MGTFQTPELKDRPIKNIKTDKAGRSHARARHGGRPRRQTSIFHRSQSSVMVQPHRQIRVAFVRDEVFPCGIFKKFGHGRAH